MPGNYDILAQYATQLGYGIEAAQLTPRILDLAQSRNWMGRRILDLGCGTGESLQYLAKYEYNLRGIDNSSEMIAIATERLNDDSINLITQDIRSLENIEEADLVISIDTLHELQSLRELEAVFRGVVRILESNKLFIFDLYTIEGLADRATPQDVIQHNDDQTFIVTHDQFDYERFVQTRQYLIFQQQLDQTWQRLNAQRTLRAYPVAAITGLLQRCGFRIDLVLNHELQPYQPGANTTRVLIFARKG